MHGDDHLPPRSRPVRQRERPKSSTRGDSSSPQATGEASSPSPEYAVGYGRPPQHSQFQPGQSGNPNGRPRGAKNLLTTLREELQTKITLRENGRVNTVTKLEAFTKRVVADALGGKTSQAKILLTLLQALEARDAAIPEERNVSRADQELLLNLLQGFGNE